jgi:hypothetical protein
MPRGTTTAIFGEDVLNVHVQTCTDMYTYTYTCTYTYTYTYEHTYACTYGIHLRIHMCIHIHVCRVMKHLLLLNTKGMNKTSEVRILNMPCLSMCMMLCFKDTNSFGMNNEISLPHMVLEETCSSDCNLHVGQRYKDRGI